VGGASPDSSDFSITTRVTWTSRVTSWVTMTVLGAMQAVKSKAKIRERDLQRFIRVPPLESDAGVLETSCV
jgi:hypothetical protein